MTITTTPLGLFGSTALYHCALCAGKECYQHSSGQHQRAVPLSPTFLGALLKPRLRTLCAVFALLSQPMCPCCIYCHVYRLCVDIIALLWCIQIWQLHTTQTHTKDRYRAGGCHTHCVCVWANYNHHIVRNNALHTAQWLCMYIYTVDHCTGVTACWRRKQNLIVHVVCPPHLPLWTDWDLIQAALRLRWASNSLLHASTYRLHTHTRRIQ